MFVGLETATGDWIVPLNDDEESCMSGVCWAWQNAHLPHGTAVSVRLWKGGEVVLERPPSPLPVFARLGNCILSVSEDGRVSLPCLDERVDAYGHTVVREVTWDPSYLACDEVGPAPLNVDTMETLGVV